MQSVQREKLSQTFNNGQIAVTIGPDPTIIFIHSRESRSEHVFSQLGSFPLVLIVVALRFICSVYYFQDSLHGAAARI